MAKKMTFDEGIKQLGELVEAMEKGDMSLEDSFAAYEKGTKLAQQLGALLDEGEGRIRALVHGADADISEEVQAE